MEQLPASLRKPTYVTPDYFKSYYSIKELNSFHTWDLALIALKHNLVSVNVVCDYPIKDERNFYINLLSTCLEKPKKEKKFPKRNVVIKPYPPANARIKPPTFLGKGMNKPKFDRDYFLAKDLSSEKILRDLDKLNSTTDNENFITGDSSSSSNSSEDPFYW